MKQDALILVRGGGDLATGTIHRLWSAGLRVLVLEAERPAAIRRQVSLCEAVYEGETVVEGLRGVRIQQLQQAPAVWAQNANKGRFSPFFRRRLAVTLQGIVCCCWVIRYLENPRAN